MINQQKYNHTQVEEKWHRKWEEERLFWGSGQFTSTTAASDSRRMSPISEPVAAADDSADEKIVSAPSSVKEKLYLLFAFAYPSGSGLHVGHVESKAALDILARYYRMMGREVFFPVGWDAFGLPAENYAVKTGIPPAETTRLAIETFRRQIRRLGISYNWETELATCHPGYYKWTQWLFLELYEKGLAYKKPGMVNWCPSCQTVLANEQVVQVTQKSKLKSQNHNLKLKTEENIAESVGVCERCETPVIQKEMEQWYFRITDYVEELVTGLEQVDWPEATKKQQLEWIGRREGVNIRFKIQDLGFKNRNSEIQCFTTRIDTVFGVTFVVVAPEIAKKWMEEGWKASDDVKKYVARAFGKTEGERRIGEKKKTGVDTGLKAVNPVNGKEVQVWVADYVLTDVGTGMVMGVPGHDSRDFEFASKFGIEVKLVVEPRGNAKIKAEQVFADYGLLINSGEYDGMTSEKAMEAIPARFPEVMGKVTTYKLRDWLISRQRYWGAPIPIVYDPEGKPHPVKREHLPWMLPDDVDFRPKGTSPLGTSKELFARVEKLYGKGWTPEVDTMDTFVDSSWYFLRYASVKGQKRITRSDLAMTSRSDLGGTLRWDRDWSRDTSLPFDIQVTSMMLPVDFYMIGPEHIVLHLLYSRFLTKFLRDQGYLCEVKAQSSKFKAQNHNLRLKTENLDPDDHEEHRKLGMWCVSEPFAKMRHQGMILGPDYKKMSKSKGNVITPDEIVEEFGADTLRMYEMFMGPLDADKPWDPSAVAGVSRFLQRYYRYVVSVRSDLGSARSDLDGEKRLVHRTMKKVSGDIPSLKFNTAIAAMMEMLNGLEEGWRQGKVVGEGEVEILVKMIAPFAPFMAEEMWQQVSEDLSIENRKSNVKDGEQESKIQNLKSKSTDEFVSIHLTQWPKWDPEMVESGEVTLVVQVNGKTRSKLKIQNSKLKVEMTEEEILGLIKADLGVGKWIEGKEVRKVIYVPAKPGGSGLVNLVVGD